MASCSSVSSARRSVTRPGTCRRAGGVRAVLGAVGEEAAPVELGRLDEAQQLVVVGLGLAGVADDEVAAERRVGLARRMSAMRRRKRSPSPHRRIRRSSGLLTCCRERSKYGTPDPQIDVDQLVGEVARVEVQQAHPVGPARPTPARAARSPRRRGRRGGPCRTRRGPGRRGRSPRRRARRPRRGSRRRRRLRCGPRNDGMAQNPHERSQPSAILTYAHGAGRLRPGQVEQVELGTGGDADRDQLTRAGSGRCGPASPKPTPNPAT